MESIIKLHTESQSTVSRSFRIGEEWDKILQEDAEAQGTSVNALLNNILKKYSLTRVTTTYNDILLPPELFQPIIALCSEGKIIEIGKNYGASSKDMFMRWGFPSSYSSIVWVIEHLFQEVFQWYICAYHVQGGREIFHLSHSYGENWSIFLSNYFSALIDTILDIKIDVEVSDNYATLIIKK
ncbi:hypothetical protein GF319_11455 [Candidatus Bathyarchaeota archaeon]|nr:hypothetical protein [Candidatus Bathyarchaeota archaeon]